jgi:RNA polymerase sigma-70 factor (ECF subfamily)
VVNGRQPRPPLEPSDEALVARVALRDATAFGLLYDRYARPAYALAVHVLGRADAEEAVQDAFLRLWRNAAQFDPRRGAFGAWFMAIARHRVLASLADRSRQQRLSAAEAIDRVLAQRADPAPDVEEQAWLNERGDAALRALRSLPAEQRRVIVLAYFGGLSQSAIAAHLDLPLGTVKKRTRLGLQKLRAALVDFGEPAAGGADPSPPNAAVRPAGGRTTHER